jgi:hypothetical protein
MLKFPIVVSTDNFYMCFESGVNNNIIKDETELKETISRILCNSWIYDAGTLLEIRNIVSNQEMLTVTSYGIQYKDEEAEEYKIEFKFKQFEFSKKK